MYGGWHLIILSLWSGGGNPYSWVKKTRCANNGRTYTIQIQIRPHVRKFLNTGE